MILAYTFHLPEDEIKVVGRFQSESRDYRVKVVAIEG